jgi:hypothetical protein
MAVLIYYNNELGKESRATESSKLIIDIKEFQLPESEIIIDSELDSNEKETRIGTTVENDIAFSPASGVHPHHAVIVKSSGTWMLIDKSNGNTFVNNERIIVLKALKHGDKIKLGKKEIEFSEIRIQILERGSSLIGNTCAICGGAAELGDEVILCPRCSTLHHRGCWFSIEKCAKCGYPTIHGEQLGGYSPLIYKECSCCGKVFKRRDRVVYCPGCKTPYHSNDQCWFGINKCKKCGFVRFKEEQA